MTDWLPVEWTDRIYVPAPHLLCDLVHISALPIPQGVMFMRLGSHYVPLRVLVGWLFGWVFGFVV